MCEGEPDRLEMKAEARRLLVAMACKFRVPASSAAGVSFIMVQKIEGSVLDLGYIVNCFAMPN